MTFAQVGKRLSKLLRYRACCWILHQGFVVLLRGDYTPWKMVVGRPVSIWKGLFSGTICVFWGGYITISWEGSTPCGFTIHSAISTWIWLDGRGETSPVLQVIQKIFKVECGKHVLPSLIICTVKANIKKNIYIFYILCITYIFVIYNVKV